MSNLYCMNLIQTLEGLSGKLWGLYMLLKISQPRVDNTFTKGQFLHPKEGRKHQLKREKQEYIFQKKDPCHIQELWRFLWLLSAWKPCQVRYMEKTSLSTLTNPEFIVQIFFSTNNLWLFAMGEVQWVLPLEQHIPLFFAILWYLNSEQ